MFDQSLTAAQEKDQNDGLATKRDEFFLPEGVIYLDGNSLGPLPLNAAARISQTVSQEWGEGLIRSWNDAHWIELPRKIGTKIAPLIGAAPENVIMADQTSVNLFKVLSLALALRPDRKKIVTERRNFPSDNYIAEGVINQLGQGHKLIHVDDPADLHAAIDQDVAVVVLTHVNYRDGRMLDMAGLTKSAHDAGALIIWDLAHSAGAVAIALADCNADFAIGCSYKYLNGGPGAPAFLYAAERHLSHGGQPLSGWFAHQSPFAFEPDFTPADNINQFLCGTPPVLSSVALDAALDIWEDVNLQDLRAKSLALTDYFIELVEARCPHHGLTLITPRDHASRGSQVSFTHPDGGYAIIAALIAEGVIGDFRAPDILRFGFTPLYTSFSDVWHAVDKLTAILDNKTWDQAQFHARKLVT